MTWSPFPSPSCSLPLSWSFLSRGCLGLLNCPSVCPSVCLSVLCPANGCPVQIPETPKALKSPDMGSRSLATLGRGEFWKMDPLDLGSPASWWELGEQGFSRARPGFLIHGFIMLALR